MAPPDPAASASIGEVPKFHMGNDFGVFEEILEQFFMPNQVDERLTVPIILSSSIHVKVYEVIREVVFPRKPKDLRLNELTEVLRAQFGKRDSTLRKRIEFFELKQNSGENVNNWYVRVKSSAMSCSFGALLDDYVKNKFLTGLIKGPVLDRMCEEVITKSLNDFLELAIQKETSIAEREVDINRLQKGGNKGESFSKRKDGSKKNSCQEENTTQKKMVCNVCGKGNHNFKRCKYKNYKCSNCGEKGHLLAVCVKSSKANNKLDIQEVDFYSLNTQSVIEPIFVYIKMNGHQMKSELDTGAGASVIPVDIFKNTLNGTDLEPTNVVLRTFNGGIIVPLGSANLSIEYRNCKVNANVLVVDSGKHVLIGRDLIRLLGIRDINLNSVSLTQRNIDLVKTKEKLFDKFASLFYGQLGTYNKAIISLRFKESAQPKFCKPRNIPFAFKQDVEKELDKMEKKRHHF